MSAEGKSQDLCPPPSPIHIRRPRARHRTASITNLTLLPEVTELESPNCFNRPFRPENSFELGQVSQQRPSSQSGISTSGKSIRNSLGQRYWNTRNLPFPITCNPNRFSPDHTACTASPEAKLNLTPSYSSLKNFYDEVESKRNLETGSLTNLSNKNSRNILNCHRSEAQLRQQVTETLPPLPPHLRRRIPRFETKNTQDSSLPGIESEIPGGDVLAPRNKPTSSSEEDRQESPALSGRFRHPCQLYPPIIQKVESCSDIQSRINWSNFPVPVSTLPPVTKLPLLSRSASLPYVAKMDTMQARYLTDLEWRVCHAVNIYVYKNGVENQSPMLVHIPPAMKVTMKLVLQVLNERVKYSVGYAKSLYKMDGTKIQHPCELEMYNNYVVASNGDKHFKCVQYGRRRSPLLVLSPVSKHARAMRDQRERLRCCLMKKSSSDDLGYVCPRASMEVIGGIGCCKPNDIGGFNGEKPPERGRSPGKSDMLGASRSKSNATNRNKSEGRGSTKSKNQNGCQVPSSRSPSPAPVVNASADRASGPDSDTKYYVKPNDPTAEAVKVQMLSEVRLDAVGGPHSRNESKPPVTINLRDLRGDDNNNSLVDAIIALQRSEQKFPPVSTGTATGNSTAAYNQPQCGMISGSNVNNNLSSGCKSRGYSESEFDEEGDDSYEESDTEVVPEPKRWTTQKNPQSRSSEVQDLRSAISHGSVQSPENFARGRTYTIRYHSEMPSDPNLPHIPPRAVNKSTSTSSLLCNTNSCQTVGVGTSDSPPLSPSFDSNVTEKTPRNIVSPPTVRRSFSDRECPAPRKTPSQGFDFISIHSKQPHYSSAVANEMNSYSQTQYEFQIPRQELQTRGFTPYMSADESAFDPFLESVALSLRQCQSLSKSNNNYVPPPSPFDDQSHAGVQTNADWMSYNFGRRPDTQGYTTYHLHSFYDEPQLLRYEKASASATIPPPSPFGSENRESYQRRVNFLAPPSAFADEGNSAWNQVQGSKAMVTVLEPKAKTKPLITIRPRPALAYHVEDFIFKKGMKSPLRQTVTKHVFPRRKSPSSIKVKQRFRR